MRTSVPRDEESPMIDVGSWEGLPECPRSLLFLYLYGFVTLIGKGMVLKTMSNRLIIGVSVQIRAKSFEIMSL